MSGSLFSLATAFMGRTGSKKPVQQDDVYESPLMQEVRKRAARKSGDLTLPEQMEEIRKASEGARVFAERFGNPKV